MDVNIKIRIRIFDSLSFNEKIEEREKNCSNILLIFFFKL